MMRKVFGCTLARLHTRDSVIVIPHRLWKELVNIMHLYIPLCHIVDPVWRWYAISSRIAEFPVISSFTACGVRGPFLLRPSSDVVEVPSLKTKLVKLKWPTPSPKEAMTPANSQKRSLISSAATLENLHINTCITEYTSIKRINTTLEFLLCKKHKGIPVKMLVTPSPFASRNGRCQINPTTPTKGKGEKEQK
jgi:predicted small lipoprotein YifL